MKRNRVKPRTNKKTPSRTRPRPKRRVTTKPVAGPVETVDITPSPKILKMLAKIEFAPWQCIAELVDNSFDEFLNLKRVEHQWSEPLEVEVTLPSAAAAKKPDAVIVVQDNGRGMPIERVREAVRAGFTGNDPLSNLGLFGMGFNVATARLGAVTRFLTSRAGESDWVGVEIDVNSISEDFRVPVIRRPKDSLADHGTRVEISGLESLAGRLTRPHSQTRLRETLGHIYSYLLDHEKFHLRVNSIAVKPRRHCVWGEERSVTRGKDLIPAVVRIDEPLGDRAACRVCGTWQEVENAKCEQCGSDDLEVRERRVWGWLGIQRYLHQKEYGIDFLRNGRKILRWDKNLFQWRDPDDPGEGEIEYPIEVPGNQGRIVGEIHLDHVPPTYTKDSFDTNDRGWRAAVRLIRGDGPVLPRRAKQLNYPPNDSPLARLHRGYRRNDPGKSYLTPGAGTVRFDNPEWAAKFQKGDPEYQDDTKWWDAVLEGERIAQERKRKKTEQDQAAAADLDDPTREFVDTSTGVVSEAGPPVVAPEKPQTESERATALRDSGELIPELNGEFASTGVGGKPVRLVAYRVAGQALLNTEGRRIPVWLHGTKGGFEAFVDIDHSHFVSFDDDPSDLVLLELAQQMIVRAPGTAMPIAAIFAELKNRYLASRAIDRSRLVPEATQVMRDIQERMVKCVSDNPRRPFENVLAEHERHVTEERITETLRTSDVDSVIYNGEYLNYVPATTIPRIVEEWPDAFLDGKLFDAPYAEVKSEPARQQMVANVTGYLRDVAWLTTAPSPASREQLIRARLSLRLLPDELAPFKE